MTDGNNTAGQNANTPSSNLGSRSLLLHHFAAALLVVVDFILFHTSATGMTIAIYYAIPMLDDSITRGGAGWTWIRIFQIVSPTITLPGGVVTVLSTYFYARRIQESERQRQESERLWQEESRLRQESERLRLEESRLRQEAELRATAAEAELRLLKAQQEPANGSRRRRRRRLR